MKRKCNKCNIEKPLRNFYKGNAGQGVSSWCKDCSKEHDRERRSTPEHRTKTRLNILKRKYGMEPRDVKRQMSIQQGRCAICGVSEKDLSKKMAADHDHKTGEFRGFLCQLCNTGLGGFRDDLTNIERAKAYLVRHENRMKDAGGKPNIYLIGAMESAANLGSGWRKAITPFLEDLDFTVLDPCLFEPHQLKGLQPNNLPEFYTDGLTGEKIKPSFWHDLKNASESHLFGRFIKYMKRIIKYDMELVEREVDVAIVLWDEAAGKGAGSHAEVTACFRRGIPLYAVATCDIPAWAKACMTEIFLNFDDLKKQLTEDFE